MSIRNFSAIAGCAHFTQLLSWLRSLVEGRDFEKEATCKAFQFGCAEGRKALLRGASQGRCRRPPSKNFQRPWALCRPARPLDQRWHLRLRLERLKLRSTLSTISILEPGALGRAPLLFDPRAAEVSSADSKSLREPSAREQSFDQCLTNQAAPADAAPPGFLHVNMLGLFAAIAEAFVKGM